MLCIDKVLSEKELDMMDAWRHAHAFGSVRNRESSDKASMEEVLWAWSENKERLFDMFGGKLILEQKFVYSRPKYEIREDIQNAGLINYNNPFVNSFCGSFNSSGSPLYNVHIEEGGWARNYFNHYVFTTHDLADNVYDGPTFTIITPDEKKIRFEPGCKLIKMIGKVAKAYNIDGFEEYRLKHSQILNQAKLTGTVCLSIHPMDFMTMSDNMYDWSSCMSWIEHGCYRRGTVECMNSRNVVVAYLKGSNDTYINRNGNMFDATKVDDTSNGYIWNNKKWRSLFIVEDDLITNIKAYPYENSEMTDFILNWLRDLAKNERLCEPTPYLYSDHYLKLTNNIDLDVNFTTNTMYNDFGTITHRGCFDIAKLTDDRIEICYSGPATCMFCGETHNEFPSEEGELCCADCAYIHTCCCCDDYVDADSVYWLDDCCYCEQCYYDEREIDMLTDDYHARNNMDTIYVMPDDFTIEQKDVSRSHYGRYQVGAITTYTDYLWDSGRHIAATFPHIFKVNPNRNERLWTDYYWIRVSDLTDEGRELIGYDEP